MTLKKLAGACAGLVAGCALSMPAGAQETGFYLGGSYGQATIDAFCSDVPQVFAFFGGAAGACDDKDNGFKIFAGFQLNRNFAIEGSYFDYGKANAEGVILGQPATVAGDATALGIAAVGILPVGERFSLFGKAGLLMTDFKVRATIGGAVGTESDDETGLHLGIGAMFNLTRAIGLRLEWERNDEVEIDMLSLGVQVRF